MRTQTPRPSCLGAPLAECDRVSVRAKPRTPLRPMLWWMGSVRTLHLSAFDSLLCQRSAGGFRIESPELQFAGRIGDGLTEQLSWSP